jgi:hypothetical protein
MAIPVDCPQPARRPSPFNFLHYDVRHDPAASDGDGCTETSNRLDQAATRNAGIRGSQRGYRDGNRTLSASAHATRNDAERAGRNGCDSLFTSAHGRRHSPDDPLIRSWR